MLVGSGSSSDMLDEEIRRKCVPNIRWIREYVLDRAAIRHYLSAADVYVFPSRREGFPVAPLEAMACGLSTVAASAPGVADIFDEGESLAARSCPSAMSPRIAKNLALLLDDAGAARILGMRARERVERAFSLQIVGSQLHDFLRERGGFEVSSGPSIRR